MGLDMYVYAKKTDLADDVQVDFDVDYHWQDDEICYWRKHPNLHGWMQSLYLEKGGQSEDVFNGDNVRLTDDDVDALEKAIYEDALPFTQGFFFGQSPEKGKEYYEIRKARDLECVELMRDALCQGLTVWYTSSW
jgi:hypothetical protein